MRLQRIVVCAALVGAAAVCSSPAWGKSTYYVSSGMGFGAVKAGSDSNPGTEALPFRTLVKGVAALKSGDTLIVRGGEYDTVNGLNDSKHDSAIPSGKSWEDATTLKAYTDERPVFRRYMPATAKVDETTYRDSWHMPTKEECAASGFTTDYPHGCWSGGAGGMQEQCTYRGQGPDGYVLAFGNDEKNPAQYIIIDGIDLDARGICMTLTFGIGARHIRFQDMEIRYSIMSATSQPGISDASLETDLQFIRTRIYSCGVPFDTNKIPGPGGVMVLARKHPQATYRHPWYMHTGGNALIDSETFNAAGTGLGPVGNNNIIIGNYIHDNNNAGIWIDAGDNWKICNNVFYNNGGIEVRVQGGGKHLIANNTVVAGPPDNPNHATMGIYNRWGWGCTIENNIVVGYPSGIINGQAAKPEEPSIIRNNLVFSADRPGNELVLKDAKVQAKVENNILGKDPMFVSKPGLDFHLLAGSPAIDAGYVNGLTFDRANIARPQGAGIDIGAYEFSGK